MRIVGGKYKGRIFIPGKKFSSRPTTDIAKEALFNILANRCDLSDMKILDLFSGTGSIGYEFISRGASEVTFVDNDYFHIRFIKEVLQKLEIQNARVYRIDAFRFVKNCTSKFDIIFVDPPFNMQNIISIPDIIINSGILKKDGLIILEHPKDYNFSKNQNFREIRKYGKVNFSFFKA